MLFVKYNIFWDNIKYTKHEETIIITDSIITFSRSFCLNLDINLNFFHNYRLLHKSVSRPHVRHPTSLMWVAT
jgi:hypothetical protein